MLKVRDSGARLRDIIGGVDNPNLRANKFPIVLVIVQHRLAILLYCRFADSLRAVYMEASFPASRVSRLGEFPGMYRKCTVLHFTIYINSRETRLAGILADRGGISLSRVSRLFM